MSQLTNPLFESQKEFLERQKQEYKNALLNDVATIKDQSQKMGKTLLMAGGALASVWLVGSMLTGRKKDKKPKQAKLSSKKILSLPPGSVSTISSTKLVDEDGSINYDDVLHQERPALATTYYQTEPAKAPANSITQSILHSDITKAITQQVTAFALVYLTKKLEEYLNQPKNTDIAPVKPTDNQEINFSDREENAV